MLIEINDITAPELDVFARLTEAQLRSRLEPEKGVFIAESPKVITTAVENGYQPLSFLMERRHAAGDAEALLARFPDAPAYTAEREVLAHLTGYTLTRGVLCAMRRPQLPDVEAVCAGARRVAVLEGVADSTNVGALFRSAAALGVSESLYEAAEIDGATGLQKFFYVTIPGIRDTIGFCVVTTLIMALQVFDQIYVMTGGGPQYATETLVGYIYNRGFQTAPYDLGYASAIAVYLFCMIAIITVILRKYAFPQGGDET